MNLPALVAHRGYARHYPENTIPAIEAAVAAGARYVEVDVQLSKDGVPVLFHDRTLERLCGVPGTIQGHTAEELGHMRASYFDRFGYRYAQVGIATLSDLAKLLAANPSVTAFVELKRSAIEVFGAEKVVATVREALKPVAAQCIVISYSLEALKTVRGSGSERIGVVIDKWRERKAEAIAQLKPEYLFCDLDGLPRFGSLQFPGAQVAIFEVDDAGVALKLAKRGVDMVETFACGELARDMALI
jgi:glycerophosphoryl diester phosphodiesterase